MTEKRVCITSIKDGLQYEVKSKKLEDVILEIMEEYAMNVVCLDEFLETCGVNGLSLNDSVKVYAEVFKRIEKDKVQRIREEDNEIVDLIFNRQSNAYLSEVDTIYSENMEDCSMPNKHGAFTIVG